MSDHQKAKSTNKTSLYLVPPMILFIATGIMGAIAGTIWHNWPMMVLFKRLTAVALIWLIWVLLNNDEKRRQKETGTKPVSRRARAGVLAIYFGTLIGWTVLVAMWEGTYAECFDPSGQIQLSRCLVSRPFPPELFLHGYILVMAAPISLVTIYLGIGLLHLSRRIGIGKSMGLTARFLGLPPSYRISLPFIIHLFVFVFHPLFLYSGSTLRARTKAKCSGTQKNWTVISGEAANELDSVARGNAAAGNFDARDAIRNIIWRHCGVGSCVELLPGYCADQVFNEEKAPFDYDYPSLVEGIANIQPESGQVALEMAPDDPMAIIVYRDLSWEPVCGENESVQTTIVTKE